MYFLIIFIMLAILGSIELARGDIILPKNIRYLIYMRHKIKPPKDLFDPIVLDDYKFYEEGFSKIYKLEPKYYDIYAFGISTDQKELSSKYRFKGRIKLEFFSRDKLILEKTAIEIDAGWFLNNDTDWYKDISLLYFEIPLLGKYKKDISVKVTVLEPDMDLKDKKSLKLYIAVSGTP